MGSAASVQEKAREMTYYEILQVDKTATDAELKKAYRKQALLLHPDRNHGNVEEATAKFAVVQAAYDVLSDSQERAWYDSHGMSMGGGSSGSGCGGVQIYTTTEDVMRWFDPFMFANVDPEAPENFWATASTIFNQLAQEEREAAMDADVDPPILPAFGNSNASWQHETKVFYDNWTNFSTIKQMAHKDMYREKDAPDRRVKRAMQGHNKKARDAAKKEYNDAVRAFVRFVKKRDPRVKFQTQQAKEASLSGGKTAAEAQAYRARLANMAKRQEQEKKYQEQAWQKVVEDEEIPTEVVGGDDDSDEEQTGEEDVIWECVVCDKVFKTEQMLLSHEQSRKHAKALHKLKREMRKEGFDLGLDEPEVEEAEKEPTPLKTEELVEEEKEEETYSPVKPKKQFNAFALLAEEDEEYQEDDEDSSSEISTRDSVEPSTAKKEEEEEEDTSLEALLAKLNGSSLSDKEEELDVSKSSKKVGKARAKRMKKNQNTAEFASTCGVCRTVFDSRTKLFEHIDKSGHAVPVSNPKKGKKGKKK